MAEIKIKHPKKRKKVVKFLKGIIFLLVCVSILGIVVYVPFFTLKEIKIIGANSLTSEDILKIGEIYIGEPLFELETDKVAGRISNDVRVEEVSVRRILPSSLEINIKERKILATITCNYGYIDLDREGKILDSYKNLKTMPVPMITGAIIFDKYIGDNVDDPLVMKILGFLQKLSEESLNKISEVAIISEDYIVAYTGMSRAVQIRIGKLERIDEKVRFTENFLKDLEKNPNPVEYIDLNYTAPFIKLAR